MNKLRSDSAFCQLTSEQTETLESWLFEERLGYQTIVEKLKSEFGLETSLTGVRRFYKRLEMERSRQSLMDAVEMGGLAVEALKSGTLKPGMLVLANKCAFELMMQSPPPVREVTALLRAITSAEAHGMKQTVFEREENERRERERERKARESWRMTPTDLEEEKEELRQERAARRKAKRVAAKKAAKKSENAGVAEAKAENGRVAPLPLHELDAANEPSHPSPRPLPVEGRGRRTPCSGVHGPDVRGSASENFVSKDGDERAADRGDGPATKDAGGTWQPSVLEEREYAENDLAEEAENSLTPLNAA